ncbi:MAG: 50S ribosomal protein L18 [Candidatus Freyarchaeota archaeon]
MPKNPTYKVPVRRRREQKTNYYLRRRLLVSGLPRLVVRRSINNISAQIIDSLPQGDKVLLSAHTHELKKKYGWKGHCGSIPAAYLIGLLIGLKAQKKKIKKTILDIGLQASVKNSSLFAVLKGALDANLEVPHGEDILPDDSRIRGEHIAEYAKMLQSQNPDLYNRQFSKQLKRGVKPENLPKHFDTVKNAILESFGGKK